MLVRKKLHIEPEYETKRFIFISYVLQQKMAVFLAVDLQSRSWCSGQNAFVDGMK